MMASATVQFITHERTDQSCQIVVNVGRNRVLLPCNASFPRAMLQVTPALDFGIIIKGRSSVKTVDLKNIGKLPGAFEFVHEKDENSVISLTPEAGELGAGETVRVKVRTGVVLPCLLSGQSHHV